MYATRVEVHSPEGDVSVALTETTRPPEERAAVVSDAWEAFVPGFARGVESEQDAPLSDGWDAIHTIRYVTQPAESHISQALVQRKGDRTYVVLIDGSLGAIGRREAQLSQLIESVRTEGIGEVSWAGRNASWLEGERLEAFRAFVRQAMDELHVPGVAVGVVLGDRVYTEGFGVRELGNTATVTPRTLFMIGSVSKSFLTLLQARMVDRGVLRWEEPLRDLLPTFDLANHDVATQVQVRHSVCACTGMPRRDYEMFFNLDRRTPESFVSELATFEPTTGFGETFQYSNHLVAVGGYATAHRLFPRLSLFDAWDRAVTEEILRPIGMRSTTTRLRDARRREHAMPHAASVDGSVTPIDLGVERFAEVAGPCGGLWSNVDDMLRYVRVNLAEGELPNGRRLVSEENFRVREAPGVLISENLHYALGLGVDDSHGVRRVSHSGGTLGFAAKMTWMREHELGIVTLSNSSTAGALNTLIETRLYELMLGVDSSPTAATMLATRVQRAAEGRAQSAASVHEQPALESLRAWLGSYRSSEGLAFRLLAQEGRVVLDEGGWHSAVALHDHVGAEPTLVLTDAPFSGIELRRESDGDRKTLVIDTGQVVYRFVRDASP